ncbi:G patch domain-containing protein [Phanerochaete sordida]|uniref:G patch domain-containing protein n=1 Tax=Phanerochaete sordida TaxID=48140 RepID=A0A9P3LFE5_9APHY|nr:G patch domain-containing protein [Phanerochaete sordida]
MTSRLKRKLNDLGVDPSSSKATENFCLIGTPLPPLEKSRDTGEFVPLWKQDVRDEKGRRRLHGAFTGGFSAGYFNTVGSKDGWAPSTFVSSRSDRAKKQQARPEDFMDDEDLAELQEGRQLVDENEEMDLGGTEAELRRRAGANAEDDSMASAIAASIAPPSHDSVGARVLRKMGWRPGQGIGPRITYEQRKKQDREIGLVQPSEEEDEEAKKHMYPRRDTPLLLVSRKENSHGLGYTPGMSLNESLGGRAADQKGPRLASGFGLGALNDADEDDLDVYDGALGSTGPKSRIVAYDAAEDDDHIAMGSSSKRRQDTRAPAQHHTTQTFRDGRPVLKGFVLSAQPVQEDGWFPMPEVPAGWRPDPRRVWEASADKENRPTQKGKEREVGQTHEEWKRSQLSADERGTMLGETPLPAQQRSIFDFMSQKDRERLENIKNNIHAGKPAAPEPGPSAPPPPHPPGELDVPHVHPSVAKAALQGFQPFTADPVKQSRYTAFLQHAADASGGTPLGLGPLPNQRIEDFNKELADYAKAATVFKPLSAAMASRFTSAAIVEHGPRAVEGLHTPDLSAPEPAPEDVQDAPEENEDPRMAAVRAGMYGLLTRELAPWAPARLLCKRFGVKPPEVEDEAGAEPAGAPGARATSADAGVPTPPLAITDGGAAEKEPEARGRRNLANVGLGEDEDQGRDTLTYQRPAMDVFKAIFASDDEDSDEEPEDAPREALAGLSVSTPAPEAAPAVSEAPRAAYEPMAAGAPAEPEKVDLATFKPTFVPRGEREARKEKDKSRKKEKKRPLVSFDDDEAGLQIDVSAAKRSKDKHRSKKEGREKDDDGERKKKRRKEKREGADEDEDSMWVEKPPPEVVQSLPVEEAPSAPPPEAHGESAVGPPRGRKRAIDFM